MMKGGIAQLMKQAQQMQENMRKMKESLAGIEVEGQSGAGLYKVVMTCRNDVKRVTIDPRQGVVVSVPLATRRGWARPEGDVERFLREREPWLRRHLARHERQRSAFAARGGLRDGAMVLETPPNADGSPLHRHDRITWSADAQGRVRQLWETSIDGGEWAVQFDGLYSRKVGGGASE